MHRISPSCRDKLICIFVFIMLKAKTSEFRVRIGEFHRQFFKATQQYPRLTDCFPFDYEKNPFSTVLQDGLIKLMQARVLENNTDYPDRFSVTRRALERFREGIEDELGPQEKDRLKEIAEILLEGLTAVGRREV